MPRKKSSDTDDLSKFAPLMFTLYRMHEEGEIANSPAVEAYMLEKLDKGLKSEIPAKMQIRLLKEAGFINVKGRSSMSLTRKGMINAERIIRRYRLSELIALNVFGLEIEEIGEHAPLIASAMTERLEEKAIEILDNPKTSPFGYPIPGLFTFDEKKHSRLSDAAEGDLLVVAKVPLDNGPLLAHLMAIGVMPGQRLLVRSSDTIAGIMSFDIDSESHILATSVANNIWVTEAEEPETNEEPEIS